MAQINEQAEANLTALQAESGTPWKVLAVDMDNYDPDAAAWMRSQAANEGDAPAPKRRRSKADAATVEA